MPENCLETGGLGSSGAVANWKTARAGRPKGPDHRRSFGGNLGPMDLKAYDRIDGRVQ